MISSAVVFYKIASICLLIFIGHFVRRMKLLPEISVSVISKYILYLAYPAYFVYYIPSSVSRESLATDWIFPLIGLGLLLLCDLLGYGTARLWAGPGEFATFRLLVALPNWVFMAMAVCEPLFPVDGARVVMLFNVGIMIYFWSFGMTSFRFGVGWRDIIRQLFLNIQLLSNVAGFAFALAFPFLRGMDKLASEELAALPWYLGAVSPFWEAIALLGRTALPLSIFQIGLMLGSPKPAADLEEPTGARSLVLTSLLRLVAAPLLTMLALSLLTRLGAPLSRNEFIISVIVLSMPAAALSLGIAEVYGGAVRLAARGILWMTLASLVTVPVATWLAQLVY